MQPKLVFNMGNRNEDPISVSVYSDAKNGYTFATVYSNKCVSVFLHQTLFGTSLVFGTLEYLLRLYSM